MSTVNPLLQMIGIEKNFPGVKVLKGVDLEVLPGEIHGLMGENGAGKSTIIKILTGVYPSDAGQIFIDGKEVFINSRSDASENGISVIYQELSLIPTLTVTENIFLGQEITREKAFLNRKEMHRRVEELIERYHFAIHPDDMVENISIAKRQMVEILKSLLLNAKLIIMDEPTASLNAQESETLFEIIHNLKEQGKSIIYISHRLEEVYAMVDRLTVLRDGNVVGTLTKEDIEPVAVIQMIIGKNLIKKQQVIHNPKPDAAVLKVENLCSSTILDHVSFEAYGGQILGIGGLVGSGRTEILKSIFGLEMYKEGTITYNGKPLGKTTTEIMRSGVGLVPEDRRNEGFIPLRTITENVALSNYDHLSHRFLINLKKEKKVGIDTINSLSIRPNNPNMKCMNLSGGNQQKVVLGKWLQRDLKVLLVDEPTVGIDVGAKTEIYDIMRNLAEQGVVVVVVSSDIEELLNISDRIIILVDGRVFTTMRNEGLTGDDILMASSGISKKEAKHE